ncbi:MAG: HD domain-containing protein, partial [Chloroflexi bacterium]|nr:HD domain-containing protein [Chloroflexota bacterium]
LGDHYVTRLTHTLEVSQIARTIARALNLNEDLTEAIALGHDMGHTPFGHIGEDELDRLHPGGFRHNQQSLRIVDQLENEGEGLNLTWEVRQGMLQHSKPRGDFLNGDMVEGMTLEAQICRVSDAVAYLNHDLADAFRAGVLRQDSVPSEVTRVLGARHSERVNTMVSDITQSSWAATGLDGASPANPPIITMSDEVRVAVNALREFMFERVYIPADRSEIGQSARRIVRLLYAYHNENRDRIPEEYAQRSRSESEAVVDYVSGMTDNYALRMAEQIEPGVTKIFDSRPL